MTGQMKRALGGRQSLGGVKGKLEGVHFVRGEGLSRTGSRKNRKPTVAELERTWEALERSFAASCEIRRRAGLPHVEPSFYAHALYAELEARRPADEVAKRRRVRKPRKVAKPRTQAPAQSIAGSHPAANGSGLGSPDVFRMFRTQLEALGTPDALAELERRRAKREATRRARMAA